MKLWEIKEEKADFPYKAVLGLGITLLFHGVILVAIGAFDVTWTSFNYQSRHGCPESWPAGLAGPCDHAELVWTWVGAGVWGGALVLAVGMLGMFLVTCKLKDPHHMRDMFLIGCVFLIFPVCPAVVTCSVLQIVYNEGVFFTVAGSSLEAEDEAKFVAPLLAAIFAFFTWIVAIVGMALTCRGRRQQYAESLLYQRPGTLLLPQQTRPQVLVQQPQQQPVFMQQQQPQFIMQQQQQPQLIMQQQQQQPYIVQMPQQPQYEVIQIPQAAPPPYYVYGPHPAARPGMRMQPPPFGPMGPHPSSFGPMGPPPPLGLMGPPPPMGSMMGAPLPPSAFYDAMGPLILDGSPGFGRRRRRSTGSLLGSPDSVYV